MADRINPETVETVKAIREWERKNNFKEACDLPGFTSYKNYFVPDSIVESSKTVLTFGVGGNVGFEKLIASSRNIINAGTGWTGNAVRNKAVVKRIHFNPVAYAPENGTLPFYYDPARESEGETISMQQQSFSLIKRQDHFKSLNVKAKNLQSILEALGLTSVDIIKADIEGLWWDFGNEILDKKINCKFIALELELNFEKDGKVETALEKAQILCDKFKENNYDIVINRRREKLMLEMLFIKKDAYEG